MTSSEWTSARAAAPAPWQQIPTDWPVGSPVGTPQPAMREVAPTPTVILPQRGPRPSAQPPVSNWVTAHQPTSQWPMQDGLAPVRPPGLLLGPVRRGDTLLVPFVKGAHIPPLCPRCGSTEGRREERQFSWTPRWVWIGLLFGIILLLIFSMAASKKASVVYLRCSPCHRAMFWQKTKGLALALVGLIGGLLLAAGGAEINGWLGLLALAVGLVAIIVGVRTAARAEVLHRKKTTSEMTTFTGVHPALLNLLPAVQ
jgi:hypothetical protein